MTFSFYTQSFTDALVLSLCSKGLKTLRNVALFIGLCMKLAEGLMHEGNSSMESLPLVCSWFLYLSSIFISFSLLL